MSSSRGSQSPRRGRRPGKKKRRNSSGNTTMETCIASALPPVHEESQHAEVAKLREHLAWARESYNESLKELQETQAICVADRMELELLRSVLKDHIERETKRAEREKVSYKIGYDSEAEEEEEEESKSQETKEESEDDTALPLEKWYQDMQGLIKDKADGELRLKGMVNQMRDLKYLMKQVQQENSELKQQVANLQDGSHEGMCEGSEHKEEYTSITVQELQQEVNKWEALYFETAEMGAKTSKLHSIMVDAYLMHL